MSLAKWAVPQVAGSSLGHGQSWWPSHCLTWWWINSQYEMRCYREGQGLAHETRWSGSATATTCECWNNNKVILTTHNNSHWHYIRIHIHVSYTLYHITYIHNMHTLTSYTVTHQLTQTHTRLHTVTTHKHTLTVHRCVHTATHWHTQNIQSHCCAALEGEVYTPYLPVVQGCQVGHSDPSVVFLQAVL